MVEAGGSAEVFISFLGARVGGTCVTSLVFFPQTVDERTKPKNLRLAFDVDVMLAPEFLHCKPYLAAR